MVLDFFGQIQSYCKIWIIQNVIFMSWCFLIGSDYWFLKIYVRQALSRAVSNLQGVEFLFRGVGVLYVKNSKVKMRFFKDFINCVDGSGHLLKLMENVSLSFVGCLFILIGKCFLCRTCSSEFISFKNFF